MYMDHPIWMNPITYLVGDDLEPAKHGFLMVVVHLMVEYWWYMASPWF
jgi:hypothetical protein